jgi:WD40 repeat protein
LFSPNSAFILVQETQEFGKINKSGLLHTDTGDCVCFKGRAQKNLEGTFSHDSALIAFTDVGSSASYISVWRTTAGNCVGRFKCPRANWRNLSFSQDSKLVAAIGNGVLCTWDIASGQCRQQTMPESYVNGSYLSITFSANLDWAAGINLYDEIRVWKCDTGTLVYDDYVPLLDPETFDINYAIIFVQNSNYIIVSYSTGLIYILDLQTGTWLVRTRNLYPNHGAVSFQPESSQLLVGTGVIEMVNLPPNPLPSAPSSSSEALHKSIKPRRSGYGISLDYSWITWDDDNFFYLPLSYQPDEFDAILVSGSVVIIGYKRLSKTVVFKFSSARGSKPVADIHFIDHCNPTPSSQ